MRTHEQIVKALIQRPGVRVEVERITRDEPELLDSLLKARQEAGLSQADVAQLRQDTLAAWAHYSATGEHVSEAAADAWLGQLAQGRDIEPPACQI